MVRITDRPNMTAVYHGYKALNQTNLRHAKIIVHILRLAKIVLSTIVLSFRLTKIVVHMRLAKIV